MFRELRASLSLFAIMMLLTGLVYPMLMLAVGQNLFPEQANGSLVKDKGQIVGSRLIGQAFASDRYFHSRPSSAGNGYDANNSSGSNLGPTNADLLKAVGDRVAELKKVGLAMIPVDLVTSSASGLDPDISPDAAHVQVGRVAAARQLDVVLVEKLVTQFIQKRGLGFLGDNRVNVLALNMALDALTVQHAPNN